MLVSSFIQLAPAGTVSHAGSITTLNLEAEQIASTPKLGSKPKTENLTLVGFADEESMKAAEQEGARSFDVLPESVKVLEASGRDLASVKAVLVITGTVKMDPPNFTLRMRCAKTLGPCLQSMKALLSSISWRHAGVKRIGAAAATFFIVPTTLRPIYHLSFGTRLGVKEHHGRT